MNIGEAAAKTQVPAKTIRYYEEIGLVRPGRDCNGYRRFRDDDVDKLTHLGRARALGFSIEDCRNFVAVLEASGGPDHEVEQSARHLICKLDQKMRDLREQKAELLRLIERCDDQ